MFGFVGASAGTGAAQRTSATQICMSSQDNDVVVSRRAVLATTAAALISTFAAAAPAFAKSKHKPAPKH